MSVPFVALPSMTHSLRSSTYSVGLRAFLGFALCVLAAWVRADFYVSPSGNDNNNGSASAPFATLTRARDAVRSLKSSSGIPAGGVTVFLKGGDYNLSSTVAFDARDSGTAAAPVVYRSAPGEDAYLNGSRPLPASAFKKLDVSSIMWPRIPAAVRSKVYVADLRAAGFGNYGTLRVRGFNISQPAQMELFADDEPMELARWPNVSSPFSYTLTTPSNTKFVFSGGRGAQWAASASDAWVHGCFANTWTDFHLKVSSVDAATSTITLSSGPVGFSATSGQPYYIYNLIEELDAPGEYFIDRSTGLLYYYPRSTNIATETFHLSILEQPLLQLSQASNIIFKDLTFQNGRGGLINVTSGDSIRIEECLLRNAGQYGVSLDGSNHLVTNCDITNTGEEGVILKGGSRASLVSANNAVTNSRIHRTSRIGWTYHPAVNLSKGCGNRVANNLIDDLPHSAIVFSGNNHVMELNEIREVCKFTSDTAAIYSGTDWGYRGNIIRNNFIHTVYSSQEGYGAHGIYLDDCVSGIEVTGNIIYNVSHVGVLVGGGRDNIIRGNIIAKCSIGHSNDDRGRTRINNTAGSTFNLLERLSDDGIRYQSPPWSTAYPACAAIPNSWDQISAGLWRNPEGCVFASNVGWNNSRWTFERNTSGTGVFSVYASMANNNPNALALINDDQMTDRSLRPAQVSADVTGFAAIPFAAIGRIVDPNLVSKSPGRPAITTLAPSSNTAALSWNGSSNLPKNRAEKFSIEYRSAPDGAWAPMKASAADTGSSDLTGLAPSSDYEIRVIAENKVGRSTSLPLAISTIKPALIVASTTRYEVENNYSVLRDITTLRTIDIGDATLDSGRSVRIYDVGDSIRIPISINQAGTYRILFRGTSGGAIDNTSFWPNGYLLALDGSPLEMHGDMKSLSAADNSYGNVYWGTMKSIEVTLAPGAHNVDITSNAMWAVADYIEVQKLEEPSITNFSQWQERHFAQVQGQSNLSAPDQSPTFDAIPNLIKYALGLSPWEYLNELPMTIGINGGSIRVELQSSASTVDPGIGLEQSGDGINWTPLQLSTLATPAGVRYLGDGALVSAGGYVRVKFQNATTVVFTPRIRIVGANTNESIGLSNLSMRTEILSAEFTPIVGFNVSTNTAGNVLVRSVGPTLRSFDVANAANDPSVRLHNVSSVIAVNDNWAASSRIMDLFSNVGAFPLPEGSFDSVILAKLTTGNYSAFPTLKENQHGVGLLEVYRDPASDVHLTNLSARGYSGTGSSTLIAGFVVRGDGLVRLLIRAVGPTLAQYGISRTAPNPLLRLYSGTTVIAENDDWGTNADPATIVELAKQVGAFALPNGSKDAAAVVSLSSGAYTINAAVAAGQEGATLIEVYQIP